MTMRNVCLWVLMLLLLPAIQACEFGDGESEDESPSIVGTYERITKLGLFRQASDTIVVTTYYYNRIDALPDLANIPACQSSVDTAAIGDHFFTIHEDYSYTEKIVVDLNGESCVTQESGILNINGNRIVTDLGEEADFEFRNDGQTLVIHARHEGILPYEENLLATGSYDWIFGAWERQDEPEEILSIDQASGDVRFDYLRHVVQQGEVGLILKADHRSDLEADCGFTVFGIDPHLFQHELSNQLTLEFAATEVTVQSLYQDEPVCTDYVLGLNNTIMENGLEYQFEVAQDGDNLIIDGALTYVKAPGTGEQERSSGQ